MPHEELLALLAKSRAIHERYLFEADGQTIRDDVAELCMAIDDVLSSQGRMPAPGEIDRSTLERSAA
jgi:hypothetical protein